MLSGVRTYKHVFAAFSIAAVLLGCTKNPLTALQYSIVTPPSNNGVTVNFCTDPATPIKSVIKYVIILDHSGSNSDNYQMNPDGSGTPATPFFHSTELGTDPTGSLRYGNIASPNTLLNFLYTIAYTPLPDAPTRAFTLIDFSDAATPYPAIQKAGSSSFDFDLKDFYNHVSNEATKFKKDSGDTNYDAALQQAQQIIQNDITAATACGKLATNATPTAACPSPGTQVSSTYVVVFMSDGSPILNLTVNGNGTFGANRQASSMILNDVATIEALTANTRYVDAINFFTVYYYFPGDANFPANIDGAGQKLLQEMATVGNGIFYNETSGSFIDYTRFAPPAKTIKYTLSDIFVTNSSVTWWSDGKLHADTDMDGLPDDLELALGSNPKLADTDGNGVSDGVEYALNKSKPTSGHNYTSAECVSLTPVSSGSPVKFADSDFDGLNDCEELILGNQGGISNPDSNSDLMADWLEFKNFIPFQTGTAPAVNSQNLDGYSFYQKVKLSLPPNIPVYELLNPQPSVYNLTQVSTSSVQDCYRLVVTNIPQSSGVTLPSVSAGTDMIRVDVVLKSSLLQDRFLYRTAQKRFAVGASTLQFNDWTDPGEIAAGSWKSWP